MSKGFATLTFERRFSASVATLWQAWTAPAARAAWAPPAPEVTVEFLEADTSVGGREVSLCKVEGHPDTRCEAGWLVLQPGVLSVNTEVISSEGVTQSAALVTAELSGGGRRKLDRAHRAAVLAGRKHGERLPPGFFPPGSTTWWMSPRAPWC